MLLYRHRQECLRYSIKPGFGGTDILVCVPNITVHLQHYDLHTRHIHNKPAYNW